MVLGALIFSLALGSSLATTFVSTPTLMNGYTSQILTFPTSSSTLCALLARAIDPGVPFMVNSGVCKVLDDRGEQFTSLVK